MKLKLVTSLLLACLVVFTTLQAQQINRSEYFIDVDPGVGNATGSNITIPVNSVNFIQNIPTTGLLSGFHKLGVRIRNSNNEWSQTLAQQFYIFTIESGGGNNPTANLNGFEYFIDSDPGVGLGNFTAVSPAAAVFTSLLTSMALIITAYFRSQ